MYIKCTIGVRCRPAVHCFCIANAVPGVYILGGGAGLPLEKKMKKSKAHGKKMKKGERKKGKHWLNNLKTPLFWINSKKCCRGYVPKCTMYTPESETFE